MQEATKPVSPIRDIVCAQLRRASGFVAQKLKPLTSGERLRRTNFRDSPHPARGVMGTVPARSCSSSIPDIDPPPPSRLR